MSDRNALTTVRARVRARETWELLVMAGAFQHVVYEGKPAADKVQRIQVMREEVVAELDRRGISVVLDPGLVAVTKRAEPVRWEAGPWQA
jgi:hypothetical protein